MTIDDDKIGKYNSTLVDNAVKIVKDYTMTSYPRLSTLYAQVDYLDRNNIDGCFIECGTWKGGSIGMMAIAHKARTPTRKLHLFDSFEGLPEPSEKDGDKARQYSSNKISGKMTSIKKCVGTLQENKKLLEDIIHYPKELLNYHVGWFNDTVPKAIYTIGSIALLRLDGDWYDSTKICIENLYPLLSPGGVLVIDDYGHWEGCKKAIDEYRLTNNITKELSTIDYTARYWIK